MTCNFHVGQKVVCIDDLTNITNEKLPEIDVGRIYVVRQVGFIEIPGIGILDDEVSVWLEGIVRPFPIEEINANVDVGFRESRFRPVVDRKTDISVFKAMLTPSKVRVDA